MNAFETIVSTDLPTTEAAMRDALGVDRPPLKILGACSPLLVQEALALDDSVAVLLPCNVVLEPATVGTRSHKDGARATIRQRPAHDDAAKDRRRLQTQLRSQTMAESSPLWM